MQNHNLLPAPKVGKEANYDLVAKLNAPTEHYNGYSHADYNREWAEKYHLPEILRALEIPNLPEKCEILEIGAQSSDIAREIVALALQARKRIRYTALDIIQRFESRWRSTPDYINTRIRPFICDAHDLGNGGYLHNEQFDVVASFNALFSMTDSGEILNRMWERTKPGGYILLSSFDRPEIFFEIPIILPVNTTQETHLALTRKIFGYSWPESYSIGRERMLQIVHSTKLSELCASGFNYLTLQKIIKKYELPLSFAIPLQVWLEYSGIRHEVFHKNLGPTVIKIFKDTEHPTIVPRDLHKAPYIARDVARPQYPFLRILNVAPDSFTAWLMENDKS